MRRRTGILLSGALLATAVAPVHAQAIHSWKDMWFWGGQAGITIYETATSGGKVFAPTFGGHWLITGKRSALYFSYDQIIYNNASGVVTDITSGTGSRVVNFDQGRFIQLDMLAIPIDGNLQVMAGLGLTMHQITDPEPQGSFATPDDLALAQSIADDAAIKVLSNFMLGFQLQVGGRFAVFGHYEFMPKASNFLMTSTQHTFAGGLRFGLGSRSEEVQ
jgi:hypothetical protein